MLLIIIMIVAATGAIPSLSIFSFEKKKQDTKAYSH